MIYYDLFMRESSSIRSWTELRQMKKKLIRWKRKEKNKSLEKFRGKIIRNEMIKMK
jgi:hypothetical protein